MKLITISRAHFALPHCSIARCTL